VPKEPNPNRPVVDDEIVEKLLAVAERVSPLLPLLIKLMNWTGRRLGSVLNLRWDDFDFENQTIRWRAEHDKKRKTWVVPMPKEVERVLLEFSREARRDRQRAGIPDEEGPRQGGPPAPRGGLAQAGVPVRRSSGPRAGCGIRSAASSRRSGNSTHCGTWPSRRLEGRGHAAQVLPAVRRGDDPDGDGQSEAVARRPGAGRR